MHTRRRWFSSRKLLGTALAAIPALGRSEITIPPAYLTPSSPGYEAARQPVQCTMRPALIAPCRTEADVIAAVKHAIGENLPLAVKSGGHGEIGRMTGFNQETIRKEFSTA